MAERFLLDENVPSSVIKLLKQKGFAVRTVVEAFGPGSTNGRIGEESAQSGEIIITLDSDFLKLHPDPGARIILVDVHPALPAAIGQVLEANLDKCVRLLMAPGVVRLGSQGPTLVQK